MSEKCKVCGEELRFMWLNGAPKWWCGKCMKVTSAKASPPDKR
jgi:formamidopyrimidine-DNA glycosylase